MLYRYACRYVCEHNMDNKEHLLSRFEIYFGNGKRKLDNKCRKKYGKTLLGIILEKRPDLLEDVETSSCKANEKTRTKKQELSETLQYVSPGVDIVIGFTMSKEELGKYPAQSVDEEGHLVYTVEKHVGDIEADVNVVYLDLGDDVICIKGST